MNRNKVYVTYENSMRANVTGVYANRQLAEDEAQERGDLDYIDSFEIKGTRMDDWEHPHINEDCMHYTPHLYTIMQLISCLYSLEGCCCGGLAHIVVDENNIDDDSIKCILEECDKEENKDHTERGLVKLICEELLKLSMQERVLLFSSYYCYRVCNGHCNDCAITNENLEEIFQ